MRLIVVAIVAAALAASAAVEAKSAEGGTRYGVAPDLNTYPQDTPRAALASLLEAIDNKRIDYVAAQLFDPQFVDRRVKETAGGFDDLVREANARLLDDPGPAKLFGRFLKEGDWQVEDNSATVRLKDIKDRCVYFRRQDGRWFVENRYQPPADKK
jgi:hypothetical protein